MEDSEANGGETSSPSIADNVSTYCQEVYKAVIAATRCAKALPKIGENYELYSSYPVFAELMKAEGDRCQQLISKLFKHAGANTKLFENALLLDERTERLVEVNDYLLERVSNYLDEAAGLRRPDDLMIVGPDGAAPLRKTIETSWNRILHQRSSGASTENKEGNTESSATSSHAANLDPSGRKPVRLLASIYVARPQTNFADLIDNTNTPFIPKLRFKHNPKDSSGQQNVRIYIDDENAPSATNFDEQCSLHPYKYELDHFEPSPWQFESVESVELPISLEVTPLVIVNTVEQLDNLCQILKGCREFAVDLEAHSYRSYRGLACLIQISTRARDYIIDTFALWRHVHVLNDPFTDPNIVKIFHGADMDVLWLQRDFGVYVVNMFDTGQAMRQLGMARFSLAYLVRHYCENVDLDKQYQLADWRIRPLPDELIKYARMDTHYLLYCYDRLRNELLEKGNERQNLLRATYDRSRDICLKEYTKRLYQPDDYMELLEKSGKRFNVRQEFALKRLYAWRDALARMEDESCAYVLPNHMLMQIAEVLPKELQGIWACCSPVPPLVRQHSHDLHHIILEARAIAVDANATKAKHILQSEQRNVNRILQNTEDGRHSNLKRHDFSHSTENEDIVPLSQRLANVKSVIPIKTKPIISLFFGEDTEKYEPSPKRGRKTEKMDTKPTPYELYLLTLEKAAATLDAQAKKTENENESNTGKKRKMFSHLDSIRGENAKKISNEIASNASSDAHQQLNVKEEIESIASDGPSPKKKQKLDQQDNAQEEMPATSKIAKTKKGKKKKRAVAVNPSEIPSYDYAASDKNMFKKGATGKNASDVFEPHKDFLRKGKKALKNKKAALAKRDLSGTIGGKKFAGLDNEKSRGGAKMRKGGNKNKF